MRSIALWKRLVGIHFRSQLSYRLSFFFELVGVFLIALLEYLAFALVLPRFDHIGGWRLGDVAVLMGMANLAFGSMDMFFSGFDPGNFGRQVRLGRFDQLLLRPVGITLQVLSSEFQVRRLGRIIVGVGILVYAFGVGQIIWTPAKMLMVALAILGQIGFFGALFITGATISFWTIDSIEVINIFTYGGNEAISYPMHIYPTGLRQFFTFILPAIFLNYYPAVYILDKPDPLNMPAIAPWLAPMVGIIFMLVALRFWRFGISHYQSTGT